MNAYTIKYQVLDHTCIQTVCGLTATEAYMLGKAKTQKELGDEPYLSRTTWYSQVLDVVTNPTCAYCGEPASKACINCQTLLCGRCGLPEPLCHACLAQQPALEGEHDAKDKCDLEVYTSGTVVATLAASKAVIEVVVRTAATKTGQRMDWHYVAGRGVVKTLGDPLVAKEALAAAYGQSDLRVDK